jgi:hypothetical protein
MPGSVIVFYANYLFNLPKFHEVSLFTFDSGKN